MRGGHHGFGMGIMACKDDLNLTDEQIEKIKAVNLDHQAEMIDFRAELAKLQLNKQSNMMSDNPDRDQAISLTRQINEVRGRISLAQVSHRFAVRDILTSEQIEKMKDCRMGKRGKWMRGDNDDDRPGRGFRRKG
jgi:Spy/CpxP family protein refolding chaperone